MPKKKVSSVRGDQGAKDKVISVRVDNDVIENFDTICNSIGITRSQAINAFMRKVISEKGFPFPVVLTFVEKRLDYICKTIIGKIPNHKIIYEKMISDLSVWIAYLIINRESVELPKSFEESFEALKNYWFYSAYNDTDKGVSFSYVRACQAMIVYQGFVNYKEYVEIIMKASKLDYICKTIIDKISNHKLIEEKMISDLSVCIAYLIINSESVELPESFDTVFEKLREYWFYSAYNDCDKEVSFSYVRVYQAIQVYRSFVNYKEYVEKIMKASKEFEGEYELIKIINDNLGEIMPQDLCKQLNITSDELKIRIKGLIEQGYIYIRPIGKYRFYSLSNSGIELFKLLSSSENLN